MPRRPDRFQSPFATSFFPSPPRVMQVIYDRATGRSKGFGFVTFGDEGAAKSALGASRCTVLMMPWRLPPHARPQARCRDRSMHA